MEHGAKRAKLRLTVQCHRNFQRLGSVIARADNSGTSVAINTYDEYGVPGASNAGRFGYTGQVALPEIGVDYYKARMYSPSLGRFMQADPVGYSAGMNLYAYVGNDPINNVDPLGLASCEKLPTGTRICGGQTIATEGIASGYSGFHNVFPGSNSLPSMPAGQWACTSCGKMAQWGPNGEIIVTANQYVWMPFLNFGSAFGMPERSRTESPNLVLAAAPNAKSKRPRKIEQFCKVVMSFAAPGLEVGYGAWEGLEVAAVTSKWALAWGARGVIAGPLGALAGAAVGGITAWALITYGPDAKSLCEEDHGSN